MSLESQVIALLSASILRSFFLIAAAWVTLRVFRVGHPASRHAVWTAGLVGMLLLPFVTVLMPRWNIAVIPVKYESQAIVRPAVPLPLPDGRGSEPAASSVPVPLPLPDGHDAKPAAISAPVPLPLPDGHDAEPAAISAPVPLRGPKPAAISAPVPLPLPDGHGAEPAAISAPVPLRGAKPAAISAPVPLRGAKPAAISAPVPLPLPDGHGAKPAAISAPVPLRGAKPAAISAPVPLRGPEPAAIAAPVPNRDRKEAALQHPVLWLYVLWLYFGGLLVMLAYRAAGWMLLRRVVSRSTSLHLPFLRESPDIAAPVAVGVLRPLVLLPPSWRDWTGPTRSAVLAHEFAHLRRRDTLTAALARLAKTVFWFHPLAWWISRQISELAESACDAEALQIVGDPAAYSRVLLHFAEGVNRAGYRVALPGLAIANSSELGRRIDQVFQLSSGSLRRLKRPGVVMLFLGVPALGFAATAGLATAGAALSSVELIALLRLPSAPVLAQIQATKAQAAAAAETAAPVRDRNLTGPHFETASLKIAAPPVSGELCWGGCGGPLSPYPESRDEITYRHFTLRKILLRAYTLKDDRISGPGSLDSDVYDVNAKAAPGTTQEQFQLMLRNLLAERLNLAAHLDSAPGYELVVAPGGPKLSPPPDPGAVDAATPGLVRVTTPTGFVILSTTRSTGGADQSSSLSVVAGLLTTSLGVPVADRTGLKGSYGIPYQELLPPWGLPRNQQQRPDENVDISALRSKLAQLGLALNATDAAAPLLVVDHVVSLPPAKP